MKTHEIELFWKWFYYNEMTLYKLCDQNAKIQKIFIYWLDRHLHNYCSKLDCIIIYPEQKNNKTQLVISANGNPKYFAHVERLIQSAPLMLNWIFTSFIQPSQDLAELEAGLDKPYVFKDITLKSDLIVQPLRYENENKIDMIVYLKNFTVLCHNQNLLQVIYIIMQDLLREKSFCANINFVELMKLPDQPNDAMIKLCELQWYIDQLNCENTNLQ